MTTSETRSLRSIGVVLAAGATGYVGWQFFRGAVPDTAPTAANQNRPGLRFWVAVWSTVYRLDPRVVQGIIRQETGGNPSTYAIAEPDGTTSWGPMHLNDGPHGAATALGVSGAAINDEASGIHYGCKWLRRQIDAHGGSVSAGVEAWNPGQGDYSASVDGWLTSQYGAGLPA